MKGKADINTFRVASLQKKGLNKLILVKLEVIFLQNLNFNLFFYKIYKCFRLNMGYFKLLRGKSRHDNIHKIRSLIRVVETKHVLYTLQRHLFWRCPPPPYLDVLLMKLLSFYHKVR